MKPEYETRHAVRLPSGEWLMHGQQLTNYLIADAIYPRGERVTGVITQLGETLSHIHLCVRGTSPRMQVYMIPK